MCIVKSKGIGDKPKMVGLGNGRVGRTRPRGRVLLPADSVH